MDAAAVVDGRISRVAQELKRWEQQFAAAHNGTKPTRLDIKQEPEIAAKYSEYNRLRGSRTETWQQQSQQRSPNHVTKSKSKVHPSTPSKHRSKPFATPSRIHSQHASATSPTSADSEDNINEDIACTFVGPTPQKDGRVLGLFDLFLENPTPSKDPEDPEQSNRHALHLLNVNAVASTPTRRVGSSPQARSRLENSTVEASLQKALKYSRTPQSSGKRFLLDTFVTPSKRRRLNEAATPQSGPRLTDSATPAFLQRSHLQLESISEDTHAENTSDKQPSWALNFRPGTKRKRLTRSFSSMIAEIRQAEDDRLDEELEMLREMESGPADGTSQPPKAHVQVADSQAAHMLGPDGSGPLSDDDEDLKAGLGNTRPLKVWKKKGQKRQTRRVIMRPAKKPKASGTAEADLSDVGSDRIGDGSQLPDGDGDYDTSAVDELGDTQPLQKSSKISSSSNTKQKDKDNQPGTVQKAVKKISATAHANFRRLKIRSSKGAKAAGKGRFGRGRR